MRAKFVSVVLLSLLLPAAAWAGEPAKTGAPGTNVEMPFLIAPMSSNGRLDGYAYISSKLVATSQSAAIEIRDKLAFIQDAFVRDVNGAPVGKSDDPNTVDSKVLAQRLVSDARRVVGAAKVADIVFTEIQFSPLHPAPTTEDAIPPSQRSAQAAAGTAPAATTPAGQSAASASQAPKP